MKGHTACSDHISTQKTWNGWFWSCWCAAAVFLTFTYVYFKESQCVCGSQGWLLQPDNQAAKERLRKSPEPHILCIKLRWMISFHTVKYEVTCSCHCENNKTSAKGICTIVSLPTDLLCCSRIGFPDPAVVHAGVIGLVLTQTRGE